MIRGLVRGADVVGEGALGIAEHELRIEVLDRGLAGRAAGTGRTLRLPFHRLEGVRYQAGELSLFLAGGDVVELTGTPALAAATERLIARACILAELTLPLRALGSLRARPDADHDRFFHPLLTARRRAEEAPALQSRLDAFDAAVLRRGLAESLREFARARYPESAPDRRALEAELIELAEPLTRSVDVLETMEASVRESGDEARLVAWREWAAAVREVFACADRAWIAIAPALANAAPAPPPRWWRRIVPGGRRGGPAGGRERRNG